MSTDVNPTLTSVRVLLVEDEPLIAIDAEDILRTMGVLDVVCARTLADGMSALDTQQFHAALLDVRLGPELSLPLAERLASSNVPFGFMTGFRDDSIPDEYQDRPIVTKPFTREDLANLLRSLVAQKSS